MYFYRIIIVTLKYDYILCARGFPIQALFEQTCIIKIICLMELISIWHFDCCTKSVVVNKKCQRYNRYIDQLQRIAFRRQSVFNIQ